MIHPAADTYLFRLGRAPYRRTLLWGWLLFSGFLVCALVSAVLGAWFFPGYSHAFTPYLKWQDMLVALLWYITFISLGGCVLVVRFLYALRAGYRKGMLALVGDTALTVRDLSHENLSSIFSVVHTALWCFVALLVGLIPEMLIGWTLYLPHPALIVLGTGVATALSLAGLAISLPAASFILIGCIGCVSYCRKMGSRQTYQLTSQATLVIDDFALTITYPDEPESMIDLNLLDADDQRHLLSLLQKRWLDAQRPWNPRLGEEIEAALEEAERSAVLV